MSYWNDNGGWFNDADDSSKQWGFGRWNIRRYFPQYDDRADYNTNAKSFYDFLARLLPFFESVEGAINFLLRRDVDVKDTNTIKMNKLTSWMKKDNSVINISSDVKISKHTIENPKLGTLQNSITAKDDGIFSNDLTAVVETIVKSLSTANGKIEVPRVIDVSNNGKLINGVDLGNLTPDTRIAITWHYGSTRNTSYFFARDLRGTQGHITATNLSDSENFMITTEHYTRLVEGTNQLRINTIKTNSIHPDGSIGWNTTPADMTPYWNEQNSDYRNQTNRQNEGLDVDSVIVYDLVNIFEEK